MRAVSSHLLVIMHVCTDLRNKLMPEKGPVCQE